MPHDMPMVLRFLSKLVLDILPAALASVIGGFLFTQYQFGHEARPKLVQVAPASEEMMRLVRDEHAMIVDYLKAQTAAEKGRQVVQRDEQVKAITEAAKAAVARDEEARAIAEAAKAPAAAPVAPPRRVADASTARSAPARNRMAPAAQVVATVAPVGPPLELVESRPAAAEQTRDPNSLAAKVLDIKDNVVAATRKVVATITDIPSWFATIGDRGGAPPTSDSAAGRFVSASW
jgi:hypothetical protein